MGAARLAVFVLVVDRLTFPSRKFSREELEAAFRRADFGAVRLPGRAQRMDAHEVRGLFVTYLTMVGATLAGPDSAAWEVPDRAAPFVEALRSVYVALLGTEAGAGFRVERRS